MCIYIHTHLTTLTQALGSFVLLPLKAKVLRDFELHSKTLNPKGCTSNPETGMRSTPTFTQAFPVHRLSLLYISSQSFASEGLGFRLSGHIVAD